MVDHRRAGVDLLSARSLAGFATVQTSTRTQHRVARTGVALELRRSASEPKAGAWLEATSVRGLAQVVLWESGELDLTIADSGTGGVVLNEYRQVTTRLGVDDVLQTIWDHLAEA